MKAKSKKYERTHNFQIWHDGSTIANDGHIMFAVNVHFVEAVFCYNAIYKALSGLKMDV